MLIVYVVKFYYRQIKLYEIYFLGTCDLFAYFSKVLWTIPWNIEEKKLERVKLY